MQAFHTCGLQQWALQRAAREVRAVILPRRQVSCRDMVVLRLSLAHLRTHKIRTALTLVAIALSVSLVVAVTSGYASTLAAAHKLLGAYIDGADATVTRRGEGANFSEQWVKRLGDDSAVRQITGRLITDSALLDSKGHSLGGKIVKVIGIRRPQDTRVDSQRLEAGQWFDSSKGNVAVLDQVLAEDTLHVKVGDYFYLPGVGQRLKLKVVGIVHKPQAMAIHLERSMYLPLETLQKFAREQGKISRIDINFNAGADSQAFVQRWQHKLDEQTPPLKITLSAERQQNMDKQLASLKLLSYMGGAVSMLAATFIVFSALSMGVSERIRTLAMLRAIGAYRSQIGRLVLLEGVVLALIASAIGVPLGLFWIHLLASIKQFEAFFAAGVAISWGGIVFGAGGSILAALAASLLPAWSAMRVAPLEAIVHASAPSRRHTARICAIVGLILIAVDPILLWGPLPAFLGAVGVAAPQDQARHLRFYLHLVVGLPAIVIGFFLLAPTIIRLLELTAGRLVAGIMGLRFALLRQQLSGGVWRSAGTVAALMVGMATLVAMQTHGQSMLNGWKLPDKFPDIFILSPLSGLDQQQIQKLREVKGIKQLMPVALVSPQLGSGLGGFMAVSIPDATLFFGSPPQEAFKMIDLDFRQGNAAEAEKLMKQGRHILITEEFARLKHVGLGGSFPLKTAHGIIDYKVAGVVWSPGIDVIVTLFDLGGQLEQRTASCVFGTLEDARHDFGVDQVYLFAANLDTSAGAAHGVSKDELIKRIQKAVGVWGLQVGDVRQIKHDIVSGFEKLLLLTSTIAFAAMAVASLGVTNTIMAAVRARRWQFGVLRGIGLTRSQLLRLVLAEAVLLGVAGIAMGVAAGLELAIDAKAFTQSTIGYDPPTTIPWAMIGIGALVVMGLTLLAAAWPALTTAFSRPLSLLTAGRASG